MWQTFTHQDYFLLVIVIWIALLSFYLARTISRYKRITRGAKNQNIEQILESMLASQNLQGKHLSQIEEELKKFKNVQKKNFQKHAFIRFNPFEDTGGDQSFVVALLDGEGSGFVISSLHSRDGTRVYAKPVTNGKPTAYQFSREEKEVVEKACLPTGKTAQIKP